MRRASSIAARGGSRGRRSAAGCDGSELTLARLFDIVIVGARGVDLGRDDLVAQKCQIFRVCGLQARSVRTRVQADELRVNNAQHNIPANMRAASSEASETRERNAPPLCWLQPAARSAMCGPLRSYILPLYLPAEQATNETAERNGGDVRVQSKKKRRGATPKRHPGSTARSKYAASIARVEGSCAETSMAARAEHAKSNATHPQPDRDFVLWDDLGLHKHVVAQVVKGRCRLSGSLQCKGRTGKACRRGEGRYGTRP